MGEQEEIAPDVDFNDYELVHHVRNALRSVSVGDSDSYNLLVGVLHNKKRLSPDEVALLVTSLRALSGAVSHISYVHHERLLNTVVDMSMWNYGPDVMDALMELVITLAATQGNHLDSCLEMLVKNFVPPFYFVEALKLPRGVAKKEQVLERVHLALKEIARLVPSAPQRLCSILEKSMPDFFKQEPLIANYVENILKLESSSLGQLVESHVLIGLVVDRLILLDVAIIVSDDAVKCIFEMELEDDDLEDTENEGVELHREHYLTDDVANKLDTLIVLTFEHLKFSYENGRLIEVFEPLCKSFHKTILNAYKSKFAQFVMFYACSLDPEICGVRFAEYLADVFTSSIHPLPTRMSAVAYLASYMARAKFLMTSFVTTMTARLAQWCSEYCQFHTGDINPKGHRVFYAGCQAVIYVLCFRMRSIVETPLLKAQLHLMPLKQIFKSSLDPLKVCLPSIVDEFVRQAKAAHLLKEAGTFVFNDVLDSELSKAYGGIDRLDMFFPFDPCLLRRSDGFIEPNFISWGMVKPTYNDDMDDDTDGNFSDNEPDALDAGLEEDDYFDEFNDSLNKMSITPRDSSFMKYGSERLPTRMQMPSKIRPSTSPESL